MGVNGVSHIGLCVADLERSLVFYCDVLGFELVRALDFHGSSWGRVLEVGRTDLFTKLIRRDGITIELMWFATPGHVGSGDRRPMNQLGLTHFAVWVDDIDAVSSRLVKYGGSIIEETRTHFARPHFQARWLMCTDPDGTRIELVEYPEGESAALGHLATG